MIISILTVLLVISLHLFPRRIREKVTYRLKRVFARIRGLARGVSAILAYTKRNKYICIPLDTRGQMTM